MGRFRGWPAQSRVGGIRLGLAPLTIVQFVEQALSTIDLVITANFVELLTAVGDELANFLTLLSSLTSSSRAEFATSFSRW